MLSEGGGSEGQSLRTQAITLSHHYEEMHYKWLRNVHIYSAAEADEADSTHCIVLICIRSSVR